MDLSDVFTCCFISGILVGILAVTDATTILIRVIPRSVKLGIVAGMGLLVALVGMTTAKIVVTSPETVVALGSLDTYVVYLVISGLVFTGSLLYHDVKGGILIGIIALSIITWIVEGDFPSSYVQWPSLPTEPTKYINFRYMKDSYIPAIISFIFVLVFDISGVVFGLVYAYSSDRP
jgi:AGZA family xanthine/uracil permease-like MFS transporter